MKRREEYYDTRVTGRKEVWDILKLAAEAMDNGDLATAQEILNASGITIPTGMFVATRAYFSQTIANALENR